MNRSFVRIGKWFVKPYEKDEKPINKRYVGTARSAEFLSTLALLLWQRSARVPALLKWVFSWLFFLPLPF